MPSKYINEGLDAYLTPRAKERIFQYEQMGCDKDLAFEMTAIDLTEDQMFELPNDMDDRKWTERIKT
jgi:hypothetical protein